MNKTLKTVLIVGGAVVGAAAYALIDRTIDAPRTVDSVDLARYAGLWYEIARYPNRYQRQCVGDVTTTYSLLAKSKLKLVNSCRKIDGALERTEATARVVDKRTNAKLKVSFFWPIPGDYWILDLGSEYEYAVVGEPSRRYLWVLSRTPQMAETKYHEIVTRLEARGFDTAKLVRTRQQAGKPAATSPG
jgi:apolipoprotein D and lipocalin family protein